MACDEEHEDVIGANSLAHIVEGRRQGCLGGVFGTGQLFDLDVVEKSGRAPAQHVCHGVGIGDGVLQFPVGFCELLDTHHQRIELRLAGRSVVGGHKGAERIGMQRAIGVESHHLDVVAARHQLQRDHPVLHAGYGGNAEIAAGALHDGRPVDRNTDVTNTAATVGQLDLQGQRCAVDFSRHLDHLHIRRRLHLVDGDHINR